MKKERTNPADILYYQMCCKDIREVAPLSYGLALWLKETDRDVATQVLGLAATLICMLQKYGVSYIDVLSAAENIIFSDENNNMNRLFKTVMDTFKAEGDLVIDGK